MLGFSGLVAGDRGLSFARAMWLIQQPHDIVEPSRCLATVGSRIPTVPMVRHGVAGIAGSLEAVNNAYSRHIFASRHPLVRKFAMMTRSLLLESSIVSVKQ